MAGERAFEAPTVVEIRSDRDSKGRFVKASPPERLHPDVDCRRCGHWSDCSLHNWPEFPAGPCDCGGDAPVSTGELDGPVHDWFLVPAWLHEQMHRAGIEHHHRSPGASP